MFEFSKKKVGKWRSQNKARKLLEKLIIIIIVFIQGFKQTLKLTKSIINKDTAIKKEIGDRNGQGTCYKSLGAVYKSVGEYEKAIEHLEKSDSQLTINKVIGDSNGEGDCYINLAAVYQSIGEYDKARKLLEKSLAIKKRNRWQKWTRHLLRNSWSCV